MCLLKKRLNLSTSWTVEEAGNFHHGIPILKTSRFTLFYPSTPNIYTQILQNDLHIYISLKNYLTKFVKKIKAFFP